MGGYRVDAPQRPWCARVEVLNITRGRRPWVRLAPSVWIWRRASFRFTERMPQELLCSASGCGGARFACSWRPSPPARSPWRPAAAPIIGPARSREVGMLGHAVRLIPPAYVKPFVKRQKNNATDAEAICEAAQRPTMRFVAPKSEQTQAAALVFRARDLLVRQRTQVINALRGHLAEFGIVVAKGPAHVPQLVQAAETPDEPLPEIARPILQILIDTLHRLDEQIADLDREIVQRAKADETAHRLMTIPGIGPVTAVALTALAPPTQTFRRGRDFAAWVGLTPLQHSTGSKQKLGATSGATHEMGWWDLTV